MQMDHAIKVQSSVWIAAPRDQVWCAITTADRLKQWYAPGCSWEIPALQVGAEIKFFNTDTDILPATIARLDEPHEMVLNWHPGSENPGVRIVTTFRLDEENGGTRITLLETGYETVPEAERQSWMDINGKGYMTSLENLKAYVESAGK